MNMCIYINTYLHKYKYKRGVWQVHIGYHQYIIIITIIIIIIIIITTIIITRGV
jgi:hypothetical protein